MYEKAWQVKVIHTIYKDAVSEARVNHEFSDKYKVQTGVYQGLVLSSLLPPLFSGPLEEFRPGFP